MCDGFVIGGGASQVMSQGTLAAHAGMPFWLQMVGTGLTTMFSVHLGAVLAQARWPAIPCINIYSHTLLKEFAVEGGTWPCPTAPGWGGGGSGVDDPHGTPSGDDVRAFRGGERTRPRSRGTTARMAGCPARQARIT